MCPLTLKYLPYDLKSGLSFLEKFQVHSKIEWQVQTFPIYHLCPHAFPTSSTTTFPPDGTFVTKDESALTHHYNAKPIVYIRVHSWCYISCEFGPLYIDMYPLLQYHGEYFHCPKNPLLFAYSSLSLSLQLPTTTDLFTVFIILPFPEYNTVEIMQYVAFQISFFHL